MKKTLLTMLAALVAMAASGQRLIEYSSGMGSRDPHNPDVWVLFRGVKAVHEGMTLHADSAHYDTRQNSFTAFRNVVIELTDTTSIYGDRLVYDGNTRVATVWADTVLLVDGGTTLRANELTYDRNTASAYYTRWGHGTSGDRVLDSRRGLYNSESKEFHISSDVRLSDSSMLLVTDTLIYSTVTEVAQFVSPTHIYSDSSVIYSELGHYNTATRYAVSYKASHVKNQGHSIDCDTLYYDEREEYGRAWGSVTIIDSANQAVCTGRYGETNQARRYSYVTDSAHVLFIDKGDSLFLHADTIYVTTDTANALHAVWAFYHVKVFRRDAQAMCDSAYYSAPDSLLRLFSSPVLWYEHYQCSADTIDLYHTANGMRQAFLRSHCFALQQVDREKFNQLKGHQGVVHFRKGEPDYADVKGNAQMVYYLTEDDGKKHTRLTGVNVGRGSAIRIYFDDQRAPRRVVTFDNPDLQTYPVRQLPADLQRLPDFNWQTSRRPQSPEEVFVW